MNLLAQRAKANMKRRIVAERKSERFVSRKFNLTAIVNDETWNHPNIGIVKLNKLVAHYRSIGGKVNYEELTSYGNAVVNVPTARKAHIEQMSEVPYSGTSSYEDVDYKPIPKMAEIAARVKANEEYNKRLMKNNGQEIVHNNFKVFRKSDSTLMFMASTEYEIVQLFIKYNLSPLDNGIVLYGPDNIIRKLEKIGA
jgi:hypothetical protein